MEQFSPDFRDFDMQKIMLLARSDAARQLFALLQSSNGPQLKEAIDQASAGNMTQAHQLLQQLMTDEEAKKLLLKLQGDANG